MAVTEKLLEHYYRARFDAGGETRAQEQHGVVSRLFPAYMIEGARCLSDLSNSAARCYSYVSGRRYYIWRTRTKCLTGESIRNSIFIAARDKTLIVGDVCYTMMLEAADEPQNHCQNRLL